MTMIRLNILHAIEHSLQLFLSKISQSLAEEEMASIPVFRRKAVWLKRLKLKRTAKNRFKNWKIVTGDKVESNFRT